MYEITMSEIKKLRKEYDRPELTLPSTYDLETLKRMGFSQVIYEPMLADVADDVTGITAYCRAVDGGNAHTRLMNEWGDMHTDWAMGRNPILINLSL